MDKVVLSNSLISTFDCPKKFYFRAVKGLVPLVKREPLYLGGLYHLGREKGESAVDVEISKVNPQDQAEADRQYVLYSTIIGMIKGAAIAFQDSSDPIIKEPEWLLPILNPLTGKASRKYMIGGRADSLIRNPGDPEDNCWTVVEEKTRGKQVTESDILKLPLDRQLNNEIMCLERARNIRITNARYRYVVKPFIRQTKNENVAQYCERLIADYQERTDFYFHEEELLVDREQVRAWGHDLWNFVHMIDFCRKNNYWHRNTSRCGEWAGCEYLPLCRGDEDVSHLYKVTGHNEELSTMEAHHGFAREED